MSSNKKHSGVKRHQNLDTKIVEEIEEYDEELEAKKKKRRQSFSIIGNIIFLFTLTLIGTIGWFVWQTWLPQDLSSLPGYKQSQPAIDIPSLLHDTQKNNVTLTLTESDVNRYIASTLKASQHGIISPFCRPSGVGIKFHDGGYMEIIIERQIESAMKQTVSLFVTIIQTERPGSDMPATELVYQKGANIDAHLVTAGTIGRLSVPQGYMTFLQPAFQNLAEAYQDLLSSITDSGRIIHISEGRIDLAPGTQSF